MASMFRCCPPCRSCSVIGRNRRTRTTSPACSTITWPRSCTAHPRRFVGLGTLPLQEPNLAVSELERCIRDLGLSGVQIGTHVSGKNLDHPDLFPVLAAAERLGAAVFVHPWDMLGTRTHGEVLAPLARRHAGRDLRGHLLGNLRRRTRAAAAAADRLRPRRRFVSRGPSAESITASTVGRTCARSIMRSTQGVTLAGSISIRWFTMPMFCE